MAATTPPSAVLRESQRIEIAEAVSAAASKCQPRSVITRSGVLHAMASAIPDASDGMSPVLIELLQTCIYAEQYYFAKELVKEKWPRPDVSTSKENLLRYYYLRGVVHVGCQDLVRAKRCFWLCLSVPTERASMIAVAAWKKLVLVQCLLQVDEISPKPLTTPKATPSSLLLRLNIQDNKNNPSSVSPDEMHMVEVTEVGEDARQEPGSPQVDCGTKIYAELAKAFCNIDRTQFNSILNENMDVLQGDGNLGIVHQCQDAIVVRKIFRTSRMYRVISMDQLAVALDIPSTQLEQLLWQLSVQRAWSIQVENGTIIFPPLPPKVDLEESIHMEELVRLAKMVQTLDISLASNNKSRSSEETRRGEMGVLGADGLRSTFMSST